MNKASYVFLAVFILLAVFAGLFVVHAQSPIGFGPGGSTFSIGLLNMLTWATATPSGCSAGAGENCVGSGTALSGDTMFMSAWFNDGTIMGTMNDGQTAGCVFGGGGGYDVLVLKLVAFSWASMNSAKMGTVNCMTDYGPGGGADYPAGWYGHCYSGDTGDVTVAGCAWKSRPPFVRNDVLYLPVERQISIGTPTIHDATMIMSPDHGLHWCNPYTVAHHSGSPGCDSSNWSANGDAPHCDSAGTPSSDPCTAASYPGSIIWPQMPKTIYNWHVVQYGQDGMTMPSGINDGCDPNTYTCFLGGTVAGWLMRVLNTDLPKLDATKFQYYTCANFTEAYQCPGSASSSWTSTFSSATVVMPALQYYPPFEPTTMSQGMSGVAYIKEFKSYLASGYMTNPIGFTEAVFWWAPTIQGPWTQVVNGAPFAEGTTPTNAASANFWAVTLAMPYNVVSTSPPHVQVTVSSDVYLGGIYGGGTPQFSQWDLLPGKNFYRNGDVPRLNDYTNLVANSGYVFNDSHAVGTLPRNGLAAAWDFYDHAGRTNIINSPLYFRDIGMGTAVIMPCDGAGSGGGYASPTCPVDVTIGPVNPGHGTNFNAYGISYADSNAVPAGGNWRTMGNALNLNPINAPAAMQGNGSYTVIEVFRKDATNDGVMWATGTESSTANTMIEQIISSGNLALRWNGDFQPYYWYDTSFAPANTSNWYFLATVVKAATGGNCPAVNMWVGVSGAIVDENAGVTCTQAYGASTKTPAVAAFPLVLGLGPDGHSADQSLATMAIYSRALSSSEVDVAYRTLKRYMKLRGITLQ